MANAGLASGIGVATVGTRSEYTIPAGSAAGTGTAHNPTIVKSIASITLGVATSSTSNVSSYATTSFTPIANDLLVVFAVATGTVAAGGATGSTGLTFTRVATFNKAASIDRVYVFVADALATAVSQTVTVTTTGDAATGCSIIVARVRGMTKSGLSAVRQFSGQSNITSGTPAPVFGSAALTADAVLGFVANATNPATVTPPSGWTEGSETGYNTPTTGAEIAWRVSGFTGTTVTWGSTSPTAFASAIIELLANTEAGLAAGTGIARQPGIYIIPTAASIASGTGAAYNPTVDTLVDPIWGGWSATFSNAVSLVVEVFPGIAEGDGTAFDVPIEYAPSGNAAGTGTAHAPVTGQRTVAHASGTGAGQNAGKTLAIKAGQATGTGAASNPTITTGSSVNAAGGLASGTGAAGTPAANIAPAPAGATGTGAAGAAGRTVAPNAGAATGTGAAFTMAFTYAPAGQATGTGAAFDATITTGTATNAAAGHASGTGSAGSPAASVQPAAIAATGTGAAANTGKSIAIGAGHAAGTGAAFDATITTGSNVNAAAGGAAGTGSAFNPTISTSKDVGAGHASGIGAALNGTKIIAVGPGFGTGSGTAHGGEIGGAPAAGPPPGGRAVTVVPRGIASTRIPVGAGTNPKPGV